MKQYAGKIVPMIELRLDEVVACLQDYLRFGEGGAYPGAFQVQAREALRELQKVIQYRGNQLCIMERVKRHKGDHLSIRRVDRIREARKNREGWKKDSFQKRG